MFDTGFVEWLWYQHHEQAYYTLSELRVQPSVARFVGGWGLPLFVFTVGCYWQMEEDPDSIPHQFLLLPFVYVPFVIAADYLFKHEFYASSLFSYPLLILTFGYLYIFAWAIFIWVLEKLRLVL
jgi:hypothetical protein